jgi:hypothetical protein
MFTKLSRSPLLVLALHSLIIATVTGAVLPTSAPGEGPAALGRWDPLIIEGEVPAVSMAVLPDGRVLYWDGVEVAHDHGDGDLMDDATFFLSHPHDADSRVLDLSGAAPQVITPLNSNGGSSDLFCAGHVILPDGRVLAVGGTDWTTIPEAGGWDILYGTPDARVFDPEITGWVDAPEMDHGRWYPSVITLPDGHALVASGIETLTNPMTLQTALERYDAEAEAWSSAGDRLLPMYPRLEVVPSGPLAGQVFYSTVGAMWGPFGWHPLEASWSLQQAYDPQTQQWRDLGPSLFGARQHGVSVMLPLDPADGYHAQVLTFGGSLQRSVLATPLAEIADLSTDPPTNRLAAPMNEPRWHHNGVLLPDGNVLAVGGGLYDNVVIHGQPNVPVMSAELYDPTADTWTTLAEMQVPRMYHSTAALLPDGRVIVGGHVPLPVPFSAAREHVPTQDQIVETRLEIFEPPYLHRGDRPVIQDAPAGVGYGDSFQVQVSDAAAIESVVLIRPGTTTHAYDSGQRMVHLDFTSSSAGTLNVVAPPDAAVAPPGPYMLFVNKHTEDGPVPSVSVSIGIGV